MPSEVSMLFETVLHLSTVSESTRNAIRYIITAPAKKIYSFNLKDQSLEELKLISKLYFNENFNHKSQSSNAHIFSSNPPHFSKTSFLNSTACIGVILFLYNLSLLNGPWCLTAFALISYIYGFFDLTSIVVSKAVEYIKKNLK